MPKKLRRKIAVILSTALTIGTCFTTKTTTVHAEEDLSIDFYEKCAELIKENWNEDYDIKQESIDSEFQTMRLIVKIKNKNIDVEKYEPKDIVKYDNIIVLQFDTIEKTKMAYEDLKLNKDIEYVEPDKIIEINPELVENVGRDEVSTNKPDSSGYYHNSWGVERIEADKYSEHLYNKGKNNSLTVAVVDTGIDYNHSYLSGRLLSGYNTIDGSYDPYDGHGHGTHVSGTIVDCTLELNKIKILPVKVLGDNGKGTSLSVGNGIRYATSTGSSVINLSLGGGHSYYKDDAISEAISKNISVVVSAGNDNIDTKDYCPAHISEAIVVASTGSDDNKSYFSNYGSSIDVCAPGEYIWSCIPGDSYGYKSGTSMAVPHISAVCAMYRLKYPNLSAYEVEKLVQKNIKDLGATGFDIYYGYGVPRLSLDIPSNEKPVITAKDITLKVGDVFKEKEGISASDAEDGNITDKIVVKENNVDTSKIGVYKVVYEVTDKDGNTVSKEIKVTVQQIKNGWIYENEKWYYYNQYGEMYKGWLNLKGTWYYLDGSGAMKTGWLNLSGAWYYLDGSGAMKTGWLNLNGTWYYMYGSGKMATNTIIDGWKIGSNGVATPIK